MKPFIIPIFIPNIGCPFRCIFCDQTKTTGKEQTYLTSEYIAEEVTKWLGYRSDENRPTEVAFYGGTFTSLPLEEQGRMLKAVAPFIEAGSVSAIRLSTRPDCLSDENLILLSQYGVKTVELGVQSMDDEVLRKSGRGYPKEAVVEAVALLKKYRFKVGIQLMPGLPGDTFEKNMATVEEVVKLAPQFVRIYPTLIMKDTLLHNLYMSGQYIPLSLDDGVSWSAEMVRLFRKNNIEVIRVGLQSAPPLEEDGNIVAGPYHPAFGELVESYLNYMAIASIVAARGGVEAEVRLRVPQRELSSYIGNKGGNRDRLNERLNLNFSIRGDDTLEEDSIVYEIGDGQEIFYKKIEVLNAA